MRLFFICLRPKVLAILTENPPHRLLRKTDRQNIPVAATRPQNIHILSQALSRELKILRIKYLKYSIDKLLDNIKIPGQVLERKR